MPHHSQVAHSQSTCARRPLPARRRCGAAQELDLVERARRGERLALDQLLHRHRAWMLTVAYRICRDRSDAEDAVQDASVTVLERLAQYRAEASLRSWLYRVTENASLMLLRRKRRRIGDPTAGALPERADARPDPLDQCQQRQQLGLVLDAARRRLAPDLYQTLELIAIRDVSSDEAAEGLGVSRDAIKTRVYRARQSLLDLHPGSP